MKRIALVIAILTLAALPVFAGEWHTGQTNLCADCHTMHASMSHTWDATGMVNTPDPVADGNWLGTPGTGNDFLLKAADPNDLCLACHDGQAFAPDVLGATNASATVNRAAGYLNDGTNEHTGHTLGFAGDAPGDAAGYTPGSLECINCHTQHGRPGAYRNLGPRNAYTPTYAIRGQDIQGFLGTAVVDKAAAVAGSVNLGGSNANGNKLYGTQPFDIFINIPAGGYTPNTATFNGFYETDNINYLKRSVLVDGVDNSAGAQCAACHANFHGGVTSANINGQAAATAGYDHFNRHPVGGVVIGLVGGGHSDPIANRYGAAASISRVKTYTNLDNLSDATPGCVSCHKAHGNGQPFGLIFALRTAGVGSMTEEGTMAANPAPTGAETAVGQRALCGQCHKQGN